MTFSETNDINRMKAELKRFFKSKIETSDNLSKTMYGKANMATFGSTEQILFKMGGAMADEFFLVYNILEVLVESFDGLDQLFTQKVSKIETKIEKMGKQGTDVSKIKDDVESLKSVFSSSEVQLVSKFIKDTNKKIEEYKKKMKDNDLAV